MAEKQYKKKPYAPYRGEPSGKVYVKRASEKPTTREMVGEDRARGGLKTLDQAYKDSSAVVKATERINDKAKKMAEESFEAESSEAQKKYGGDKSTVARKVPKKDVGGPYDVVTDVDNPNMAQTPAPTMEEGEDLSFSEGFEAALFNSENAEKMARGKELRDAEVTMSRLRGRDAADQFAEGEGVNAFNAKAAQQAAQQAQQAAFEEDFKITHGGPFDPKSKMDRGKMETIREMRAKNPNATPTQLAIMIYRLPKKK